MPSLMLCDLSLELVDQIRAYAQEQNIKMPDAAARLMQTGLRAEQRRSESRTSSLFRINGAAYQPIEVQLSVTESMEDGLHRWSVTARFDGDLLSRDFSERMAAHDHNELQFEREGTPVVGLALIVRVGWEFAPAARTMVEWRGTSPLRPLS